MTISWLQGLSQLTLTLTLTLKRVQLSTLYRVYRVYRVLLHRHPSTSTININMEKQRTTRASKRRRITPTPPQQPSPKLGRSISPDELASHPHTPVILSRQHSHSTPSLQTDQPQQPPRRTSYSPVSDSSPDELDHTAENHAYYRTNSSYPSPTFRDGGAARPSSKAFEALTMQQPSLGPPSPPTPEYSRISTPIGSPRPGKEETPPPLGPARFTKYRCRQILKGHKRGVAAVRFSEDGAFVASCCE